MSRIDTDSARNRLEAAEVRFDELTQGGRDLVDQSGTTYRFSDGATARGIQAAATYAEQVVSRTEAQIRRGV